MTLVNTNQLSKMTSEQIAEYKMNTLMNIEDSILSQVFGNDDDYYNDDIITEADAM